MKFTSYSISVGEIVVGSLSCAACSCILLTFYAFRDIRNLIFMKLIIYVTINDFLASLGIAMGSNGNFTFQCIFQGFVTNFNYLSSLFWSTVISYRVWLTVHQKPLQIRETILHVICWGIPLLVAVLPYTTNMYGKSDDDSTWCFITDRSDSPSWSRLFWELWSFYIWLWLAVMINISLVFSVSKRLTAVSALDKDAIKSQIRKLWLYPAIAIFCWAPTTIIGILRSTSSYNQTAISNARDISNIIAAMQGMFFPAIFFYINPTVRKKWQVLLYTEFHRSCCSGILRRISFVSFSLSSTPATNTSTGEGEEDPTRQSEEWKTLNMHGVEEWKSRPDSMYALEDSFVASNTEAFNQSASSPSPWSVSNTSIRWQSSILTPSITASPLQVSDGVELTTHSSAALRIL